MAAVPALQKVLRARDVDAGCQSNHYTNHSGSPNEECTQSDAAPITLRAAADANQSISTWACASEKRAASARAGLTPMILKFTPWMSGFVSGGSGPARIAPRVGEVSAARRLRRAELGEGGGARDQCCTQRCQMVTGLRIIRCFWFAFVARCPGREFVPGRLEGQLFVKRGMMIG